MHRRLSPLLPILCLLLAPLLPGDVGVIIPAEKQQPDPAVLSLAETRIDITVDNGSAIVKFRQIFQNKTANVLEGDYTFSLPSRTSLADFAVWDGVVRIPGVILERREAEEIYQRARAQAIDPGLLSTGERTDDPESRSQAFTARIVPIPAYGTKRLELEYQQRIPVENLASALSIPLRPSAYGAQSVGTLEINFELRSAHTISDFALTSKAYPLTVSEKSANRIKASARLSNVNLSEDLAFRWTLDAASGLQVTTYRDPAAEPEAGAVRGFFEARHVLPTAPSTSTPARTVVVLLDLSLSTQWEKLERSYLALETILRSLTPADRFQVIAFHKTTVPFRPAPVSVSAAEIDQALAFMKGQRLRAGTDLLAALQTGLTQATASNGILVLLSDGNANLNTVAAPKIAAAFTAARQKIAEEQRPKVYVFAAGDDVNEPLLKLLSKDNGLFEAVRSSEPPEFKLQAFVSKLGRNPVRQLSLQVATNVRPDLIYPLEGPVFAGSTASWVGTYAQPGRASVQVRADSQSVQQTIDFPADNKSATHLPRLWAQARVDALLEKIARDGEDRASIDEIIRLARRYKLVTPYTSFLAAPRALLRPRLIRPGDPVIRIKTDPEIVSILAYLPFGEVKPLRYLTSEGTWQTRFLAPADMQDGTYPVRLLLRDRNGRTYQEQKSFVILSKAPALKLALDKPRYRAGDTVTIKAGAPSTTRQIVARMTGMGPVFLRWNDAAQSNTGTVTLDPRLPAGKYRVEVTAEDFAHNIGRQEVWLEVVP